MTEEIWEDMNRNDFASLASWPSYDKLYLTQELECKWDLLKNITDDINKIKIATKKDSLEKISIIVASKWKSKFYNKLMVLIETTKNQGEIMNSVIQDDELKKHGKIINQMVGKILKNVGKYSKFTLTCEEELQFFNEINSIIKNKFMTRIEVNLEDNSNEKKANQALPGKPAIVIY